MDINDIESRGSLIHNGTVLASDKLHQNVLGSSSVVVENERASGATGASQNCKQDAIENGWTGGSTHGSAETVVAPWDGIELPQSHVEESSHAPITIGYVGNDWDEEYDRGQIKKIRQAKLSPGGTKSFPNTGKQESTNEEAKDAEVSFWKSSSQDMKGCMVSCFML